MIVQGPVKEQQPDGMSHRGQRVGSRVLTPIGANVFYEWRQRFTTVRQGMEELPLELRGLGKFLVERPWVRVHTKLRSSPRERSPASQRRA